MPFPQWLLLLRDFAGGNDFLKGKNSHSAGRGFLDLVFHLFQQHILDANSHLTQQQHEPHDWIGIERFLPDCPQEKFQRSDELNNGPFSL
jgi:hypothetical protein